MWVRYCQNPREECGGKNSAITNSKRAVKSNLTKETGTNHHLTELGDTLGGGGQRMKWCADSKGCLGGLSIGAKIIIFVIQKTSSGSWIV